MKIVATDNFARETISDILICENVNEFYGKQIVNLLNNKTYCDWFYRLEKDDYKLYNAYEMYG